MLEQLLLAFVPLFVVVDPLASVGLFLGLTHGLGRVARNHIALRACLFATVVLAAFALAGQGLLKYLGIELYSLQVAGGLLLVLIGLNMLREGEEVPRREIAEAELRSAEDPLGEPLRVPTGGRHPPRPVRHDPSFVPLGLPMLAGPGAISLVIVQGTEFHWAIVALAIALAMFASLLVLLATARASHVVGENARRVITRIMGLLTVAFAMQYVFNGVNGWLASRGI